MTNIDELSHLAEQFKGRGDDCGKLARAILADRERQAGEAVAWATFKQVTIALSGLLEQVEKFAAEHGEADFETSEALRAVEAAIAFDDRMPVSLPAPKAVQAISAPEAFQALAAALAADPGYAWSWHCAVWASAHDEGMETGAANRAAARFMHMAFAIDTSKHEHFNEEWCAAAPSPDGKAERCPYCDGTGDVHSVDGQWRGRCSCPDGKAEQAEAPSDARWWSPPDSFAKNWLTNGAALHPLTANLVVRFARALAAKLAAAEVKYGYSDGWRSADWMDECRAKLAEHVAKGDPRDVAAYCAFLWHHGESTATQPTASPEQAEAPSDADPLTPEQEEWVMDLAERHNLGRRVPQIGAMRGVAPDVFYTDASYRTHELFCFAAELLSTKEQS